MSKKRLIADLRHLRRKSGPGVPSQVPPVRIWHPSMWVLMGGLVGGTAAIAAGATVAGEAILLTSQVAGLVLSWFEDRSSRPAWGRLCRVCGAHDDSDLTGSTDLRMWVAQDLCLPCATDGLEAAERRHGYGPDSATRNGSIQRRCRVCGCTDERACVEMDLHGDCVPCHWVADDLCSSCAPDAGWGEGW